MNTTLTPNLTAAPLVFAIACLFPLHEARAAADDKLSITVSPYLWAAGLNGTVGARGLQAPVDASFVDILNDSDSIIGFFGRLEVRKGRFGGFVDGGAMRLGVDGVPTGLGQADVTMAMAVVDFGLLYRFVDSPISRDPASRRLTVDAMVGGQFMYLGIDIEPEFFATRSQNREWIDPIIGLQASFDLSKHWAVIFRGNVGGFGVSSEFTWGASLVFAYRFPISSKVQGSVFFGYKALGDDYSAGTGVNAFKWDVIMHGLVIGMDFKF